MDIKNVFPILPSSSSFSPSPYVSASSSAARPSTEWDDLQLHSPRNDGIEELSDDDNESANPRAESTSSHGTSPDVSHGHWGQRVGDRYTGGASCMKCVRSLCTTGGVHSGVNGKVSRRRGRVLGPLTVAR